ncbi:hypothetical protein MHK_005503, partial [Candidatus Magnetomorum sp. HK-1]
MFNPHKKAIKSIRQWRRRIYFFSKGTQNALAV